MRTVCWSVKGGSGTTVAAVALALVGARDREAPVLLVDLAGDVTAVLGLGRAEYGLDDWFESLESVGASALDRLLIAASPHLQVLPGRREHVDPRPERLAALASWLRAFDGNVVVDLGVRTRRDVVTDAMVELADRRLLVTRACYLSLRLAVDAPYRPDGVVLLREEGRKLDDDDVEASVGAPVVARLGVDATVARAVDSGLLNTRLPRTLTRGLRGAA